MKIILLNTLHDHFKEIDFKLSTLDTLICQFNLRFEQFWFEIYPVCLTSRSREHFTM